MADLAEKAVKSAVYTTLNSDSNLTSTLGASVFQTPADGDSSPYVYLDETSVTFGPMEALGQSGREVVVGVHVWSDQPEAPEADNVADRVMVLLDWATLTVSGWTFVSCHLDSSNSVRTDDYQHRILRFRVRVHE